LSRQKDSKIFYHKHKEKIDEKRIKKRNENLEMARLKGASQMAASRAVKAGKIVRPPECSKCGRSDVAIEGHHMDYSRPLELTWLCKSCHKKLHFYGKVPN
jgi:hypothetical protein